MINAKDLVNLSKGEKYTEDDIVEGLLQNPDIRDFIERYDLSPAQIEDGLIKLMDYNKDTYISNDGVKESRSMPGFKMDLQFADGQIKTPFVRVRALKKRKMKCLNMPSELTDASFADFKPDSKFRIKAYRTAKIFCQNFGTEDQTKGMYIFGPFRSGKTYLASAIANELANKGFDVIEIYYPELSAMIKNTFNDSSEYTAYNLTEELKSCDLLILDDFGGESINPYVRDEIIGVVLNYRMIKKKPIIITTNIAQEILVDAALRKDSSEGERIKAQRIMERIKEMTEVIVFDGKYMPDAGLQNEELF